VAAAVSDARRTVNMPKLDREEFSALVKEGLRRFGRTRKA
jgi:hypothetical protein